MSCFDTNVYLLIINFLTINYILLLQNRSLAVRLFSQQTNQNEPSKPNMNVAGLSENCVAVPAQRE